MAGVTETLTWAQLYRRTLNVAHEVKRNGAIGDRAVIPAQQEVAYTVAFQRAIQAALIAVPRWSARVEQYRQQCTRLDA